MRSFSLYAVILLTSLSSLVTGQATCAPNKGSMCGARTSNNRPCCYPWTCDSKSFQCLRRVGDTCIADVECATPNKCINGKCKNPTGNGNSSDCGMTQSPLNGPCTGPNNPTPTGITCCELGYTCMNFVILGRCKALRGSACTQNGHCASYPTDVCVDGICTPACGVLNRPCCSGDVCSSSTICDTTTNICVAL